VIDRLLGFFGLPDEEATPSETAAQRIRHATAVLLAEIARADHERQPIERAVMLELLATQFGVGAADAESLLRRAEVAAENSVSLHEFTRLLHEELDYAEKERVIEMLWRIALADRVLDKYEDYMVGKIADLLYIARGDVIRLRNRVYDSLDD